MRRLVPLLCLALGACDGPAPSDAGPELADAGPLGVAPPAEPAAIAPACPEGWTSDARWPVASPCLAFAADPPADCPLGALRVPGHAECVPSGPTCPADFPSDLPAGAPVVYVSSGATGGDGTRALPFGTIAEGLAAATAGTTVAVARGTYTELIVVRAGVSVIGACTEATEIVAPTPDEQVPTVQVLGGSLANVVIRGERPAIVTSGDARLEHIATRGTRGIAAVSVSGGTLSADGLSIQDTAQAPEIPFAIGLAVVRGGAATVTNLEILNGGDLPVAVEPGSTATLQDTFLGPTYFVNHAMEASGEVTVERAWIERGAVLTSGSLTLRDVHLRDVDVQAREGAPITMEGVFLERALDVALNVLDAGSTITLTDVVIDVGGDATGVGIRGATTTARGLIVIDSLGSSLSFFEGRATIEDVVLEGCAASPDGYAIGFLAGEGAEVDAARMRVTDSAGVGMLVSGSTLRAEDVTVARFGGAMLNGEAGVAVGAGGTLELTRADISDGYQVGVLSALAGTTATLRDVRVANIRSCSHCTIDVPIGVGLAADQATLNATSFSVEGAEVCGAQAAPGASLRLELGVIRDSPIGLNLQAEELDPAVVAPSVTFMNTARNIARDVIAVPVVSGI